MIAIRVLLAFLAAGGCLLPASLAAPPPGGMAPLTGRVTYYAARWDWDRIAANHDLTIPPGRTPIATADCRMLGRTGWLELSGSMTPIFVADCTAPQDLALVQQRGIVAEIPYPLAGQIPGLLQDGWVTGTLRLTNAPIVTAGGEDGAPTGTMAVWPVLPARITRRLLPPTCWSRPLPLPW